MRRAHYPPATNTTAGSRPKSTPKASARHPGVGEEREEEPKREREAQSEKNQRENKRKELPELPIQQRNTPPTPKVLTAQAATDPNLPVTLPAEE